MPAPPHCEKSLQTAKRITVLGLGNVLLGDEGFGVHFVEWFKPRWRLPEGVSVLDGGVLGYRLLDTVTECEHLIAIDVLKVDDEPGSVYRFSLAELQARLPDPTSAHEVEFPHVLVMAELMDAAPEAVFLCVVPARLGETTSLHPALAARFELVEELQARLPAATSAHEVEFPHVLLMAELMDSAPAAVFVCVVPECIGETTGLQPALRRRFGLVEDLVLAELRRLAVHPVRRDA